MEIPKCLPSPGVAASGDGGGVGNDVGTAGQISRAALLDGNLLLKPRPYLAPFSTRVNVDGKLLWGKGNAIYGIAPSTFTHLQGNKLEGCDQRLALFGNPPRTENAFSGGSNILTRLRCGPPEVAYIKENSCYKVQTKELLKGA